MKVQVNIRNIDGKGWTKRNVKATVVGDLKTCVVEMLQPSWKEFTFTLDSNNIFVFRKEDNELRPLPDNPKTPLCTDYEYFAVEYFETVPTDMYRDVKIDRLQPSIYSHPDFLKEEKRWTSVSPLYCAAMKDSEMELPWHSVSEKGNLDAHGVSLYFKDEATVTDIVLDPFRPVDEDEQVGNTRLTLEQYMRLVNAEGAKPHPVFGIIETFVSHQMTPAGAVAKGVPKRAVAKGAPKRAEEGPTKKPLASERMVCFRYKLREGTNLAPFGMALIYDNSSKHHCSLIRKKTPEPNKRMWMEVVGFPFLPLVSSAEFLNCTDSNQRNALLRDNILCPFAEHEEPETFYGKIVGKPYLVFPKVAALFALNDFLMKASAEPVPLEKYDDPSQHSMYKAALVLYHIDTDNDVRMALEELEGAAYHISDVDSPCVLTLHSAMQAAIAMDIEDLDEMKLDTETAMEVLADGIGAVNGLIQATALAKTTAPVTQGVSTNESPESTDTQP
jgi:hypothetical protein